jgi:hypothetical protein
MNWQPRLPTHTNASGLLWTGQAATSVDLVDVGRLRVRSVTDVAERVPPGPVAVGGCPRPGRSGGRGHRGGRPPAFDPNTYRRRKAALTRVVRKARRDAFDTGKCVGRAEVEDEQDKVGKS